MSEFLSYLYTVFTRIWDIISYPLEMVENAVEFINSNWDNVSNLSAIFPPWVFVFIALVFSLGIILFVLKR